MSHFLDRLRYFGKVKETFSKGHGITTREDRQWEDTYRNRWRHDKVVRSTHGVNCTGGCSWQIFVKNGLVAYEMQQTDYPRTRDDLPNHEPRGCQRGASFSWYLYSPHRIKYPLVRGRLVDLYRIERATGKDPVDAWAAIQSDSKKRDSYVGVRGLGGFVRADWEEVTEMIAAANIHTIKKWGPDRIYGFSPIPAMSMISYAAGSRYLSLIGAGVGSFYDWYCDLPPASPQVWGEQTDVPESADWYNSKYIIVCGANLPMTRTPDAHFAVESRYNGTKIVSMAPDYAEYVKFADLWMPVKQGTDAAAFMAMGHVALKEFHVNQQDPYFTEYARSFTDFPMQVILSKNGDQLVSGRFLRASDFDNNMGEDNNPEWKTIVFDSKSQSFVVPNGSVGFRWGEEGKWNILEQANGSEIEAELSCIEGKDVVVDVTFPHFNPEDGDTLVRKIPARSLKLASGEEVMVTSVFDLQVAQYGVDRGLGDNLATSYDDATVPYTPAWAAKVTGVPAADLERTGREFADNASKTRGKSMVILGAAINHWYHNDMNYRGIMNLLHICGCVGQSGGGWAHYVGQEKLRPQAGWAPIAFALDWHRPPRHTASTTYWYFHTDQWRYERVEADGLLASTAKGRYKGYQLGDYNVVAQRLGWTPSMPHFDKNPIEIVKDAEAAGATDEAGVSSYLAEKLKSGEINFAYEDIDAEENHPRNLFVWRSNLIGCSSKGHEYFLKHLLGAQNGVLSEGIEGASCQEIKWREKSPTGKLDLMVDINFRLNSTGAYSDIVLPTATWYEKADLNTTDMHPFIHPLSKAVDPAWESRSDWQIFKTIAKRFSELSETHLGTQKDVVSLPMQHDTPMALAQPFGEVKDWKKGDCDLIPGKTAPIFKVVERDYPNTHAKYSALGPLMNKLGNTIKGIDWNTDKEIKELASLNGVIKDEGISKGMPSLAEDIHVCDAVMRMAPETNGEVAHKSWSAQSKKTGIDHSHLYKGRQEDKITYRDIVSQPRKIITAPTWSGIESEEVSYNACYTNLHEHIPLRTLTGRAQFYQDHEWMLDFGEGFCAYKPAVDLQAHRNVPDAIKGKPHLVLNWITPHSKWGIHSTYQDNLRMLTLFRGGPYFWVSEEDARSIGLEDNDWVEAVNDNGATVARVVVSQRVPNGMAIMYHAQEKNVNVPGSNTTGKRGGILNSVTRTVPKPTHMIGGYAQLSYAFNYYGTVGSNRDEHVIVHKIEDQDVDWLERPLTPEREAKKNPPGINN
ncbi:MAG: nitrate reductase subunit alpha [Gammaproteobacteria bacterium]|jgi:nitrate reductase alpha subunit|nr:nitrate reductase subunit alpha [Gammaproteobacteria bacterium]MBT3488444.1 nitrate reductase subunit alpha [Gammaproteobacteria bacterium]MBT3718253.1 nitrate reductase subunit alpha [Gammaproteobacteria bacterium]MBT3846113.1 nitrate reductase subunit alpha [Gammaproteobacteria bacterium]MBT3893714.1 nitrate reductase subunit alpha [Gammaproteobacteria bacterium]